MPRSIRSMLCFCLLTSVALASAAESASLSLDIPFVAQTRDGCGAASIAMVMRYWQQQSAQPQTPRSDPAEILRVLYDQAARGIYASAMLHYFQQNGYQAFALSANTDDLEHQLRLGRPLIVALKPGSGLHYVVVAGIDPAQKLVLVNDPAQRKLLKVDESQFAREWKATGNWALLAVPDAAKH